MKAIIVENNLSDSWHYEMTLETLGVQVQGVYRSWKAALSKIKKDLPDFMIVDLHLDNSEKGLDFIEEMKNMFVPAIVCSGYSDQVNIDSALNAGVIAVISKPIDQPTLIFQIKKLIKELEAKKGNYLVVREKNSLVRIPIENIFRIEIEGNYSSIFIESNKRYVLKASLKKVFEQLDSDNFIRCHRSTIINAKHIKSLDPQANKITFTNGEESYISRRYRASILQKFTP